MLLLPDVTLLCIDTKNYDATARVAKSCLTVAHFGDVVIHSDRTYPFGNLDCRFVKMNKVGMNAVLRELWYVAPWQVRTSHALYVHWDSGIDDTYAWDDDFLRYDYIGAPWPFHADEHQVGNGGFSLRSLRLMRFMAEHSDQFPFCEREDAALCRQYRPLLERHGFFWAPVELAQRFSYESGDYRGPHFGHHGFRNQ